MIIRPTIYPGRNALNSTSHWILLGYKADSILRTAAYHNWPS